MIRSVRSVLALAGLGALAGCSKPAAEAPATPGAAPAAETVRFQTDFYAQAEHGGFYQAKAKGFYRDAGLDVTIFPANARTQTVPLLLSGERDLAMGRCDDVELLVQQHVPVEIVGVFMEHDVQAIMVHDKDPVRSFADLNGRTVMASVGEAWVSYAQKKYHVSFSLIPIDQGMARFAASPDLIQQCFFTNEPYYLAQSGVAVRAIPISSTGFDAYRVVFGLRSYIDAHRRAVKAFMDATTRGWVDFVTGDPTPGKALILAENPHMTAAVVDYAIKQMREQHVITGFADRGEKPGQMTAARLNAISRIMADNHVIDSAYPAETFADFSFQD